jgi:hypothetical protein
MTLRPNNRRLPSSQHPLTTLHLPHIRKPPQDFLSSHWRIALRHYPLVSHQQYHLAKHPRVLDGPHITAVAYQP